MIRVATLLITILIQVAAFADSYHPYSITEVHADIQDNKIILTVKSNAEDLIYFHHLAFDSMFVISRIKLLESAQLHVKTVIEGFYILDQQGNRLSARMISTNFSSLNGKENFSALELLKYPLYYVLQFELDENTDVLEFHQALSDAGLPAVSILSISKNRNTLAENIELTKEKPFTMNRHAVSIGLPTELNFMVSYLSLTDTHVTHELTLPFELLKSFVQLHGENSEAVLETIREFIATSSAVEVNKTIINPEITSLDFQSGSSAQQRDTLLVNIRITYSLKALSKEVSVSWKNFNWKVRWFKSLIDSFHEKAEHNFSRFEPTFKATRKLNLNTKDH